jgi:lysozyme family protein
MKESYEQALRFVIGTGKGRDLGWEGGYVNHPKDPGGATNRGVTQATYDLWRKSQGLPKQSVKGISPQEVASIYKNKYWAVIRGDELPVGVDMAMFDFAVNSGPSRAAKFLQSLLRLPADGIIGPNTLRAANEKALGLTEALCDERLRWLHTLPTFATFGKGWTRRVTDLKARAVALRRAVLH